MPSLRTFFSLCIFGTGVVVATVVLLMMIGLGLHRQGSSWAISGSATLLVFGPALVITSLKKQHQLALFGASSGIWALFLLVSTPVYFPAERNQALRTGFALVGLQVPIQDWFPEPVLSQPRPPQATVAKAVVLEPPTALADNEIALAYEGEGRRLTVELAMEHQDRTIEMDMMLDTGATYTTLPRLVLATLGIHPNENHPTITLQTANGERRAQLVLIDKVWLGDLAIHNVAIAVCDACASEDTTGLLGLNVTGGYNLNIDADRKEVLFRTRKQYDRSLDIKPFVEIDALVSRYQGDRVEVEVSAQNQSGIQIANANVAISCRDEEWIVPFTQLEPTVPYTSQRRLPDHVPCERYQIRLASASWID